METDVCKRCGLLLIDYERHRNYKACVEALRYRIFMERSRYVYAQDVFRKFEERAERQIADARSMLGALAKAHGGRLAISRHLIGELHPRASVAWGRLRLDRDEYEARVTEP